MNPATYPSFTQLLKDKFALQSIRGKRRRRLLLLEVFQGVLLAARAGGARAAGAQREGRAALRLPRVRKDIRPRDQSRAAQVSSTVSIEFIPVAELRGLSMAICYYRVKLNVT